MSKNKEKKIFEKFFKLLGFEFEKNSKHGGLLGVNPHTKYYQKYYQKQGVLTFIPYYWIFCGNFYKEGNNT